MKSNTMSKFNLLAISIGIVYLWFGALKFFPDLSPAESLAKDTIFELTFGLITPKLAILLLALWETCIGALLILNKGMRIVLPLAILHILLTFTPLIIFPEKVFNEAPITLTLLGQYIVKNLIILSALVMMYHDARASQGSLIKVL
tara:strand:+ start:83 stop:520 length:438 start_codon:yes stop_codon:yes gene_type:complete